MGNDKVLLDLIEVYDTTSCENLYLYLYIGYGLFFFGKRDSCEGV